MNSKIVDLNPIIPIIIIYANATNTQIIKERWSDWKNKDPITCCSQEIHFTYKETSRLNVKVQKKIM